MQLILSYNRQGSVVGYVIKANTKEDQEALNEIRNLHFFSQEDNPVLYDGIKLSSGSTEQIDEMSFITKDAMKIRDKEIAERESYKVQALHAEAQLSGLGLKQTGEGLFSLADPALQDVQVQIVQKKRPYKKRTA